jgi:hypothetical protein
MRPCGAHSRRERDAGGGVLVVEATSALPEARGGTGFFGSNADAAVGSIH